MLNNRRRRPTHPGAILREDILPEMAVTQAELARRLGVSRRTVSELIHERRPVTTDMAHRLARVFDTTPESWLRMQEAVDLWVSLEANRSRYIRLRPLAASGRSRQLASRLA
jgi:addiction module HigA family antidote